MVYWSRGEWFHPMRWNQGITLGATSIINVKMPLCFCSLRWKRGYCWVGKSWTSVSYFLLFATVNFCIGPPLFVFDNKNSLGFSMAGSCYIVRGYWINRATTINYFMDVKVPRYCFDIFILCSSWLCKY